MLQQKKIVLCSCPLWNPFSITASLPALNSYLKKNNCNPIIHDFNIEFYRYVFTTEFLKNSYNKALNFLYNNKFEQLNLTQKQKYLYIKSFLSKNDDFCKKIIKNFDKIIKIFNDKNDFYIPEKYITANLYMTKAMQLASLPYYPYIITNNYNFDASILENTTISEYAKLENSDNIFYDFIKGHIHKNHLCNIDYLGISISSHSQLLFAISLSKMLKQINNNIFISIGGQYITHTHKTIKDKAIFDYADILLYGDSEESLAKSINIFENKKELSKLPNIIYKTNNNIFCNPSLDSSIASIPEYSYDGIDFDKYFLPEVVLPIQTSRNCYWGKCVFCNFTHGSSFTQKSIDAIANEIQIYNEKYNAKYFYFVDSCLEANYIEKLADEILKRNLKIYFISLLRAEPTFNSKLLKKLYKAGLRSISTGFESSSQRILDKYKKGINVNNFINYLKAVKSANIFINATFMVGFPDSTDEENNETFNFIEKNLEYLSNFDINKVMIPEYSIMNEKLEKYGITPNQLINKKEFHISFLKSNINNKDLTNKIYNTINKISITKSALTCKQETQLLYLAKLGRKNFEKMCMQYDEKFNKEILEKK